MELYKNLIRNRIGFYMKRVDADIICEICSNPYKFHPFDEEILEFFPELYLHKLCNGILAKS